ncbi:MAG: EAL domain-containing protein [Clostridia bacterium]|nr:EAL domain-containing protein [Clostridia bacterium]
MEQHTISNMILEKNAMVFQAQPKWTFGKNTCNTYEVFVSHFHNEEGQLLPSWPILQIVEQEDALSQLFSITLLWEAVRQTVDISRRANSNLTLSLNLLPKFAENEHFIDQVRRCLDETGLEAKRLQFEVSELQKLNRQGCENLNYIHDEMGVSLVMGNFGTGSTNMPLLYQVHFDMLELDKSYTPHMLEDERVYRAVIAIQHMADTLNMQMCAKGIETQAEFEAFEEVGFFKGQGPLIGSPMTLDKLEEYVKLYALAKGHK